ncbi:MULTISPECIES: glycosyltransferase [Methanobrevibacter]|uniref:Spore maturation protein CgeB n=1 Tax=Methanobrevibacter gottschalkii DSM 11977 TaxID=1122229 RepID=A0A3N5B5E3_9EURY|nr:MULTISPECIES: glycosyltransferase [Methanobrevibacter]OEC94252.1 hypothetical protein A9505_08975 [Methanobrevibacter sp. A27]RPF52477.1 spore maturation protein CgeB [Methanobrevibacter gottschalkii DSM 11977]
MGFKVSIIIPVFNVEFYIESCILSLQNQTIGFENLEIIFIDDCSTDNTSIIIEYYAKKYKNIRAIYCNENSGVAGKPRNIGMVNATSDYIMFIDPDDTFSKDACEVLYDKISKSKVDVVSGLHSKKIHGDTDIIFPGLLISTFTNPNDSWQIRKKQLAEYLKDFDELYFESLDEMPYLLGNFAIMSKIYRKSFLFSNNINFPEEIPGEDSVFLLNVFLNAKGIIFINKIIFSYYTSRDDEDNASLTHQSDLSRNLGRLKAYKMMLKLSKDHDKLDEFVNYLLCGKMNYFLNQYVNNKNLSKKEISIIINESYDLFTLINNSNCKFDSDYKKLVELIIDKNVDELYKYSENDVFHIVTNNHETKYIKDIKVAVIMDPFTYTSYSNEFEDIIIEPSSWLETFENEKPDLFFCESAYSGVNKKSVINGVAIEDNITPWQGKIGLNLISGNDNRKILFDILNYCNNHNIPTIFWNKEDPTSFDIKQYNFIDTSLHFDYIFTTDEETIPRYNARGHDNVYPLLFASQIKLFNPIEYKKRTNDIIFAGSWYNQFSERSNVMREFFNKIINSDYNLKIYDRASEINSINRKFPKEYSRYVFPKVHFDKMPSVYKESKISLNINTVTNSYTMFARRVFELMSSNTLVLSNYSKGIFDLFKDNVIYLDKLSSLNLDKIDIENICENNLYDVLENHTYYNRFKYILNIIGFKFKEENNNLIIIYGLNNKNELEIILNDFESIKYVNKTCLIYVKDNNLLNSLNERFIEDVKFIGIKELIMISEEFNQSYFFIIRDLFHPLEKDFIRRAFLHYNYLDKNIGVKQGNPKYNLAKTIEYKNILFNIELLDKVLEGLLKYRLNKLTILNI